METYQAFWNKQAATAESAIAAVDGSASEDIVQLTGHWSARQVCAALNIQSDDCVLELGCGVGRIGRELAPMCGKWIGCDISANMISSAKERLAHLDNISFFQLNRTSLHMFEDNSFDKVYTVAVLCHLDKEDVYLYIKELQRVLKPGGIAYIETWNMAHPVGWKRWEFEVNNWVRADQAQRKDVARNQFSVPQEIELFTKRAGFEIGVTFSDSPWVQMVGIKPKPGNESLVINNKRYLQEHSEKIANTAEWGELFSAILDVVYGVVQPEKMLSWLNTIPSTENTALYRDYLLALWRKNSNIWGQPPQS